MKWIAVKIKWVIAFKWLGSAQYKLNTQQWWLYKSSLNKEHIQNNILTD